MAPCGIGKKFIAELLGTFFLVFFGTGSAVITLMISESVNPNNVGIGILGGLGDWIAIALAFGLTVMVCIYLFGRISGAHLNPAVTIGLLVSKNISLADLKGTLEILAKTMFGEEREIRLRPSFFPFTEPSIEVDVSCFKCGGKGCPLCKGTGWIEILGSGMVHPNVLKANGYDPDKYTGFAFGIGPERIAMLKYGITDIRNFYTNDLRFLNDFNRVEGGK